MRDLLKKGALELGVELNDFQVEQFFLYMSELKKWNEKINLTSIVDEREIIVRHFLDSLILYRFINSGERVLDMGAGAGFPGLALLIANPALDIVCMDKVEKKVKFMRHIIRSLSLHRASVINARIETNGVEAALAGSFDVIVSRAFTSIEKFLTLSFPYMKAHGRIIAVKGPKSLELTKEVDEAIGAFKWLSLEGTQEIDIPSSDRKSTVISFVSRP